ncbi:MAG: hypothetical protein HOY78_35080 [Saccharothrix sp.]|nr:hypothetical protein [Saccharothrix sp.]
MVRLKHATTKGRRGRFGALVAAVASVAGMVLGAAPATAADYPTTPFSIEVGASYYKGSVTWYNRAVEVVGSFKAVGCRRVYAQAWAGGTWLGWQSSSTWCDRSGPVTLGIPADISGGATEVDVWMTSGDARDGLEYFLCYRATDHCDGPYVGRPYVPRLDDPLAVAATSGLSPA